MATPRQTTTASMPPCPAWPDERIDGGPHCCDLACVFGDRDQAWHPDESTPGRHLPAKPGWSDAS